MTSTFLLSDLFTIIQPNSLLPRLHHHHSIFVKNFRFDWQTKRMTDVTLKKDAAKNIKKEDGEVEGDVKPNEA